MKKQYNKVAARMLQMGTQTMICSSGLTGQNEGNQIIGNGGKTSGGSSAGFDGVDARGNNGSMFNMD